MAAGACVGSKVQFVPSLHTRGITAAEEATLAVCRRCPWWTSAWPMSSPTASVDRAIASRRQETLE